MGSGGFRAPCLIESSSTPMCVYCRSSLFPLLLLYSYGITSTSCCAVGVRRIYYVDVWMMAKIDRVLKIVKFEKKLGRVLSWE